MTPHWIDFFDAVGTAGTLVTNLSLVVALWLFWPQSQEDPLSPLFHLLVWLTLAFAYLTVMDVLAWDLRIDYLTYTVLRRAGGRVIFALSFLGFLWTACWRPRPRR